jgi:hypothetical protein
MKDMIIRYTLNRLTEPSTIRGFILFLSSATGLSLSTQQTNSAVWVVLGIVGLIGTILPDKLMWRPKPTPTPESLPAETDPETGEIHIPEPDYRKETETQPSGWGDKQ